MTRSLWALWGLALLLMAGAESTYLMRSGYWTGLWRRADVLEIDPDGGAAFRSATRRPDLDSQQWPSPAIVYENDRPLPLGNAPLADVRAIGSGRFAFTAERLVFAATDNSDPRTNGRRYVIAFPPVTRAAARVVFGLTALVWLAAAVVTARTIRFDAIAVPPAVAWTISAAAAMGLVALAVLRAAGSGAAGAFWIPVAALNIGAAIATRWSFGPRPGWRVFAPALTALTLALVVMALMASRRSPGCGEPFAHSNWNSYCLVPDSASYYVGYEAGSTRQPLYPWFIAAVTAGTGFDGKAFAATAPASGEVLRTSPDPLMRVTRAQITVLLAAALVACAALMRLLDSTLPAVVTLALYDQQFLTGVELNSVLTEPLVQSFVLLLTAAAAAFVTRPRGWLLYAAALCSGLAYLTRQASAYSGLLVVAMIVIAVAADRRAWWQSCAGAAALLAALFLVPDLYGYATSGDIGLQQTSLQYQYRIARALQHADASDLARMPDDEARRWLADALPVRDAAHRAIAAQYADDESARMIQNINANLYDVATPVGGYHGVQLSPAFFMKVATPILQHHWRDYLGFSFQFWQFGLTRPGLVRLDAFDFSPWISYGLLFAAMLWLGGTRAVLAAALVLAHWASVALTSLFAVPIPRMIAASEFLVVVAALIVGWTTLERLLPTAGALRRQGVN